MSTEGRRSGGLFALASTVVARLGLRRTRMGRRLIAGLNVLGERAARFLYLRRGPIVVDGHRMFLSDRHAPSLAFVTTVSRDEYELETRRLLQRLVREGMTVFDVGAHVGFYTLMAARLVGARGRVYAFEAEPENYALLERNVALNGYANVVTVAKAVSDRTGTSILYVSHQGNDRHSMIEEPGSIAHTPRHEVETVSLDEFAASAGCPRVDVVKMDIEGAEPLALAGMSRLLAQSESVSLIVEFAPGILRAGGADPAGFLTALRGLGFSLRAVELDLADEALQPAALPRAMLEIERRGAINLLCQKRLQSAPEGTLARGR